MAAFGGDRVATGPSTTRRSRLANASADADARRFCHAFYEVGYSTALRDPLWSAEHLTRDMASGQRPFRPAQGGLRANSLNCRPRSRATVGTTSAAASDRAT